MGDLLCEEFTINNNSSIIMICPIMQSEYVRLLLQGNILTTSLV